MLDLGSLVPMKLSKITSIGRPVDFNYPTNRAIGILSAVVLIGTTLLQLFAGKDLFEAWFWGVGAGLTVFLAWALCRELDPDHDRSAFAAAGLAVIGLFVFGLANLGRLFWLLLAVRVVNRTTGLPATIADSLAVTGLGGWLVYNGNWGFGVLTVVAFLLDSQLAPPHRQQIIFAGLSALSTLAIVILQGPLWPEAGFSWGAGGIALGLSAVFVPVILGSSTLKGVEDESGEGLKPVRVQAGQALALIAGIEIALWSGTLGFKSMMPLWATVVGAAVFGFLFVPRRN
jgi:hypothetical protein